MESEMRKIVLENGSEYCGTGFGDPGERVCELVFNTSMVGYQEIVSDPSYTGQAVVMTYPIIGNYGITDEDFETKTPTIGALMPLTPGVALTMSIRDFISGDYLSGTIRLIDALLTAHRAEQLQNSENGGL